MSNPFNLVYTTLYDMLASRKDIRELVRLGNQIRFDSVTERDPIKKNISSADLPELVLTVNGLTNVSLRNTSSSTMLTRSYSWLISTGDFRLNEFLQPVEWAVFTGMLDWCEKLTALQWCGRSFVKRVDFIDATNGFTDTQAIRGIVGWSAIWSCEVEMHFVTKELKDGCP